MELPAIHITPEGFAPYQIRYADLTLSAVAESSEGVRDGVVEIRLPIPDATFDDPEAFAETLPAIESAARGHAALAAERRELAGPYEIRVHLIGYWPRSHL